MGGGPSRSHIQNQHTQGITIVGTLAWIASIHKLNFMYLGLAMLWTWVDSPNNLLELIYHNIMHQFVLQIDVQHNNTYPFCEETYDWYFSIFSLCVLLQDVHDCTLLWGWPLSLQCISDSCYLPVLHLDLLVLILCLLPSLSFSAKSQFESV